MKRILLALFGVAVAAGGVVAQTTGSQAGAGATAGSANAQVQGSASAQASQDAKADRHQGQKSGEATGSTAASAATSGSASANAGPNTLQLQDDTSVHAVLIHQLDSRKNKPGDTVTAKVTEDVKQNGQVVLHKGSMLEGHVTEAQARAHGDSESALGVAFDHARTKGGQEVPLQLGVQALASAETASTATIDNDAFASAGAVGSAGGGARAAGGGLVGGAGSAVGSTAGAAGHAAGGVGRTVGSVGGAATSATSATGSVAGQAGGLDAAGHLMSNSSGVFGLQGMSLTSNLSNATQGSVVASTGKSVQLSSGTQMVLRAAKQ
jgi:hypothetical protein